MRYIPRQLAPILSDAAKSFPAVVVAGPRRAGKTTLLRQMFPAAQYVLLEGSSHDKDLRATPAELSGTRASRAGSLVTICALIPRRQSVGQFRSLTSGTTLESCSVGRFISVPQSAKKTTSLQIPWPQKRPRQKHGVNDRRLLSVQVSSSRTPAGRRTEPSRRTNMRRDHSRNHL